MTIREEIRQKRKEVMQNGTPAEKRAYFFEYYTLHLILAITILVVAICLIVSAIRKPDILLNGIVLNVYNYENKDPVAELGNKYLEHIDMNTSKNEVSFNSTLTYRMGNDVNSEYSDYETSQVILTQCAGGTVDFIISPLHSVLEFANNELFLNLEDMLTEEELELYKPYLLYVDRTVVEEKDALVNDGGNPDSIPTPDPTKPEEMKDPIPVLIDITSCKKATDIYNYTTESLVFGVTVKAPNLDRISSFLEFLFQE